MHIQNIYDACRCMFIGKLAIRNNHWPRTTKNLISTHTPPKQGDHGTTVFLPNKRFGTLKVSLNFGQADEDISHDQVYTIANHEVTSLYTCTIIGCDGMNTSAFCLNNCGSAETVQITCIYNLRQP